jgi:hypothetical protein
MKKLLQKLRSLFRKKPVLAILKKLPNSWNDITLKQFYQLQQVEFNSEDSTNGIDTTLEMASILSGIAIEEFESLPMSDIITIGNHLEFMVDKPKENNNTSLRWKTIDSITYDNYVCYIRYSKDILNNYHTFIKDFSINKLTDEEILNLPITDVMNGFFLFRKNLTKYMKRLTWQTKIKILWLTMKQTLQTWFRKTKPEENN